MTVKCVPNVITSARIALSLALLPTKPFTAPFFALYMLCGITDIADGFLARKLHAQSAAGAVLDSVSDTVFVAVTLFLLIPAVNIPLWALLWTAGIALLRVISALIGGIRFRRSAFTHTLANKAAGLLLFCFPLLYELIGVDITAAVVCCAASVASAEELMINIFSDVYRPDRKSIFEKTIDKSEKM